MPFILKQLTDVPHLDLVGDDGGVVEPAWGPPGEEDVRVGHGLHHGGVGRVRDVAQDHAGGSLALAQDVPCHHLCEFFSIVCFLWPSSYLKYAINHLKLRT